jgi:hypothetical protein
MVETIEHNRRRAKRYPMDVPVRLGEHEGRAQDLSTRGIYFTSPHELKLGSIIEIHLTLPNGIPTGPLDLHLFARVLRLDDLGDLRGIACEIESWAISEADMSEEGFG